MPAPEHEDPPRPPEPPRLSRRVSLPAPQLVGLLLVAGPPLLALAGVFGPSAAEGVRVEEGLEVHVTYPARLRHRQAHSVEVRVRNVSGAAVEGVRVAFPPEYVGRFSRPDFTPTVSEAFRVDLGALEPGAEGRVRMDVEGGAGGRYTGSLRVEADGIAPLALPLRTLVFP